MHVLPQEQLFSSGTLQPSNLQARCLPRAVGECVSVDEGKTPVRKGARRSGKAGRNALPAGIE